MQAEILNMEFEKGDLVKQTSLGYFVIIKSVH
jgi:hypothetical protein